MKDLTVEISELKKNLRATSLYELEDSKEFFKWYMYCDSSKHKKKDCFYYNEDLKKKLSSLKKVEWDSSLWDNLWNLILKEEVWKSL